MGKLDSKAIFAKIVDNILPKSVDAFYESEVIALFRLKGLPCSPETLGRARKDKMLFRTRLSRPSCGSHKFVYLRTELSHYIYCLVIRDLARKADMQRWSIAEAEADFLAEVLWQSFWDNRDMYVVTFFRAAMKAIEADVVESWERSGTTNVEVVEADVAGQCALVLHQIWVEGDWKSLEALYKRGLGLHADEPDKFRQWALHKARVRTSEDAKKELEDNRRAISQLLGGAREMFMQSWERASSQSPESEPDADWPADLPADLP